MTTMRETKITCNRFVVYTIGGDLTFVSYTEASKARRFPIVLPKYRNAKCEMRNIYNVLKVK